MANCQFGRLTSKVWRAGFHERTCVDRRPNDGPCGCIRACRRCAGSGKREHEDCQGNGWLRVAAHVMKSGVRGLANVAVYS